MFVGLYTGRCSCWSSWQLQRYCTVHCTSRSRTLLELTVECGLSIINLSPLTRSSTTLPNTVPHVFYFYKPCIVLYPFRESTLQKMPSPLSRYHTTFIMTQCCRICNVEPVQEPLCPNTCRHFFNYVPEPNIASVQN